MAATASASPRFQAASCGPGPTKAEVLISGTLRRGCDTHDVGSPVRAGVSVLAVEGVDPRDAAAVTGRLLEWATGRFGAPVAPVAPPSSAGAGFDSYIHMVHLDGDALPAAWTGPLVVRILPTADRADGAHREAAVQGWCAERGFPAARVLHVFDPGELLDLPVWPAIEAGA